MATVTSSKRQQTHTSNTYESNSSVTVGTNVIMNTSCTVDGRDVSADGAKLDGIACGATNVTNNNQLTNGCSYGKITCVTTSTGLDGGASIGTATISLDLSELADGTAAIVPTSDEVIYLDGGTQKRKLFSEIFGCNAYNSTAFSTCLGTVTSIATGTGIGGGTITCSGTLTVGAGTGLCALADGLCVATACNTAWNAKTTCTGTTTPSNTQTFTNKSGSNNQWTNDAGYTTCTGTGVGNITCVTTSTGLDGAGSSGTVTVSLDLSELTDMTAAVAPASDELILLDSGAERRKLFCEIFGSNAYNSTTIPTNNNQLTNGAGYTTCTGNVSTSGNQSIAGVKSFSGKIGADGGIDGLTLANGGIAGSNFNITGVNQLTISDPGEGIVWGGGANTVYLYAIDDATDNIMNFCGASELRVNNSKVWTAGNDGSGSGLDADLLDGCQGSFYNQSGCAGINCTGTTTASNSQTFTNKSGCISQWTNNSGYTTCTGTGDITAVTAGNGLTGGASSGAATLNVGAGTAITVAADTVSVNSTCNSTWNAKTTCTGTTTPSNTQTFTNKSGCISQWTNNSGYTTCTGTGVGNITCVTTSAGLDGAGSSGTVTVSLDLSELTDMTAAVVPTTDEIILLDNGAERRKLFSEIFGCNAYNSTAFTTCIGDVTGVTAGSGLTGGGSSGTPTLNVGAGTAITVAADTVGVTTACNSAWNGKTTCTGTTTPSNTQTFTNKSGCISQWNNDSGYTTCTGDITAVTAGNGLTGGASSGAATLNVGAGTGITVAADTVSINSTCNSTWNGKTTCTGTTTPSNTQTFTNKSGCISQWTNNSGYTTCTGTTTPSNTQTFTNKSRLHQSVD